MIAITQDISASLGPARNQGKRPTCMAFAVSDMNAHANSTEEPLSVDFLCHYAARLASGWSPGRGFTVSEILNAAENPGQPTELLHPYKSDDETAVLTAPVDGLAPLYTRACNCRGLSASSVLTSINAGAIVGLVLSVTLSLYKPVNGIVSFDANVIPGAYHAVIGVGIGNHKVSDEPHVLIRNSWGETWGQAGHAWVPLSHLLIHLYEGFSL